MTAPAPDPARRAMRHCLSGFRVRGPAEGRMGPFFLELGRAAGQQREWIFGAGDGPEDRRPRLLAATVAPHLLAPDGAGRIEAVDFPPEDLAAVRAGGGLLVLDMSTEGPAFAPWLGQRLHAALGWAGISASSAVLLIQNARFEQDYRAWAVANGLAPLPVITANAYAAGMWLRMTAARPIGDAGYGPGFALEHDGPRRHRYACLNFTLRAARAMLVAWLLERPERGFISFSVPRATPYREEPARFPAAIRALSLPETYEAHLARVARLLDSRSHLASDADDFTAPWQRVYSLPVAEVASAELFIVTETEIAGPEIRRFTEKTFKALVSGLPFIVFGCARTIAALRALGFDLLEDVVDHGYDAVEEPPLRFAAALDAVARFLARPPGFTPAEMARLSDAAAHNRVVLAGTLPAEMVLKPLRRLAALCAGGASG